MCSRESPLQAKHSILRVYFDNSEVTTSSEDLLVKVTIYEGFGLTTSKYAASSPTAACRMACRFFVQRGPTFWRPALRRLVVSEAGTYFTHLILQLRLISTTMVS